ncbi:MAG: ATP-binding protein [Methanosarcinales archaeon]|nr:MAG: ATP-binding protein [Methanosarcinales archaeon]
MVEVGVPLFKWDPLDYKPAPELVGATIKRQIKNILKSYTGWYDSLSELIQNALDSIDARKKEGEEDYVPNIWIKIDMQNNLVCVTDNGIGFSDQEFKNFLAPNVSFKTRETRGNKGVGATYLGYGFNFLQIGTKTSDFSFIGTMKGGREWVEDESHTKPRPQVQADTEALHEAFQGIDRGSTFALKFIGDLIRPKDLTWVGASNAEQWGTVLRIKTPLGGIYFDKECLLQNCNLMVIDESGNETHEKIDDCSYIFPHKVISHCIDLKEIRKKQQELIDSGKDDSKLPDSFHKLNGLYRRWNANDIISRDAGLTVRLDEKEKDLINKYNINVYSFFCYSTDIWDKYNDGVVNIRKNARILRGGLQLATNNMPQGDLLMIPLTKNTGFQNVTHSVIHFDEADPDLGRKGFQPELRDLSQKIAASTIKPFSNWKKLLKTETGAPPDIVAEKAIYDWIKEQEYHEESHPLVINREDLFLPLKEPSITSEPLNEQDVISLFNQLLAGGVIRGIKIMSTSQHQKYDGIFKFWTKKPFENHIFDKKVNPLGIEKISVPDDFVSAPEILEYKHKFDALIEEIEKGDKNERDIKLVIAWTMGNQWKKRYDITPLLHFDTYHHRPFHGATHIVKDSSTGDLIFYAIILDELIKYINSPETVQDYQKKTYMEEE